MEARCAKYFGEHEESLPGFDSGKVDRLFLMRNGCSSHASVDIRLGAVSVSSVSSGHHIDSLVSASSFHTSTL